MTQSKATSGNYTCAGQAWNLPELSRVPRLSLVSKVGSMNSDFPLSHFCCKLPSSLPLPKITPEGPGTSRAAEDVAGGGGGAPGKGKPPTWSSSINTNDET